MSFVNYFYDAQEPNDYQVDVGICCGMEDGEAIGFFRLFPPAAESAGLRLFACDPCLLYTSDAADE